jgi:hypothetical protein
MGLNRQTRSFEAADDGSRNNMTTVMLECGKTMYLFNPITIRRVQRPQLPWLNLRTADSHRMGFGRNLAFELRLALEATRAGFHLLFVSLV